jgi:hypothetical protein
MTRKQLDLLVTAYLVFAIALDITLFVMTWASPGSWFRIFHGADVGDPYAILLLRRAGGHWLAFAVFQVLVLLRKDRDPAWLAVAAGLRWSDVFTDVSYVVGSGDLNAIGLVSLIPPALFNGLGGVMFLAAFRAATVPTAEEGR